MLSDGQVQIRDLVMGPGTPYALRGFNPFNRETRSEQSGTMPWSDGGWAGAEFLEPTNIPLRILVKGGERSADAWLDAHLPLMAAFEPIGSNNEEVELKFCIGTREFTIFGRPRVINPDIEIIGTGKAMTEAAFVANDPRIYSSEEFVEELGLPQFEGGMTWPMTWPMTWDGFLVDGSAEIVNGGLAPTFMRYRIDGPVVNPRISVKNPDGDIQTLRVNIDLQAGHWLSIDTQSQLVLLNDTVSRRADTSGTFQRLFPGTSDLRYNAPIYNDQTKLTVRFRHAW